MNTNAIQTVIQSLNQAKVDYLVVGGLAVVAHGHGRLTVDLDLVIDLTRDNILRMFEILNQLSYRPCVPITAEQFSDPATRESWILEKNMQVLNFHSDQFRATPVDVFVSEPFDFKKVREHAEQAELPNGATMKYVDINTLLEMKLVASRPKDLEDIRMLRLIQELDDES